jgi:hypothetical protein
LDNADVPEREYEMQMAFSRGLYSGWFRGTNNQELVHARFGKKRGVYLGRVTRVESDRVAIQRVGPLKPGDGVVFDAGRPEEPEEGGRVYEVTERGARLGLALAGAISTSAACKSETGSGRPVILSSRDALDRASPEIS